MSNEETPRTFTLELTEFGASNPVFTVLGDNPEEISIIVTLNANGDLRLQTDAPIQSNNAEDLKDLAHMLENVGGAIRANVGQIQSQAVKHV